MASVRERQARSTKFPDVRKLLSCQLIPLNSFLMKGFCALAKSPDTQTRLFADFLFRRTDARFPAQVANVAAAHHPAARIQILLLDTFEKFRLPNSISWRAASAAAFLATALGLPAATSCVESLRHPP